MEFGKGIAEFMFEVGVGEGVVVTIFGGVRSRVVRKKWEEEYRLKFE